MDTHNFRAEQAHTCSNFDVDSTTDNQSGPGRLVDNCMVSAGRHFELFLGKFATRIKDERVAADNQIPQQRAEVIPVFTPPHDHPRSLVCAPAKTVRTCSVADLDSTVSNLTGPGRAIDNLYLYAGRRLELLLGKAAMKVGRGPLITTRRILQRRAEMISMTTWHDEQHGWCYDCQFLSEFGPSDFRSVTRSPGELRKLISRINKDCKHLIMYARSKQFSTQSQAVDSILDLSTCDGELRAILLANGASTAISDVIRVYERFRCGNRNDEEVLLNASRKALVSLEDVQLNKLLKDFVVMADRFSDWNITYVPDDAARMEMAGLVWGPLIPYLRRRHHAFLVMRTLSRSLRSSDFFRSHVEEAVLQEVAVSPNYYEWEECDAILCLCLRGSLPYETNAVVHRSVFLFDWLFRNAQNMPRFFEMKATQLGILHEDISQLDATQFGLLHSIQRGVERGLQYNDCEGQHLERLKNRYSCQVLQPLLNELACPVMYLVRKFVEERIQFLDKAPDAEESCLYEGIVQYTDLGRDPALQARAWGYIAYFLSCDIYRCNLMLAALEKTAFGLSGKFPAFAEARRKSCVPRVVNDTDRKVSYKRYFRTRDSDNTIHYFDKLRDFGRAGIRPNVEVLEIPEDWIFEIEVEQDEVFLRSGHFPLPAGNDGHGMGMRSYLAEVYARSIRLRFAIRGSERYYTAICDGTRPGDLRLELRKPHRSVLLVPTSFIVPVLRYTCQACAEALGIDAATLFTTGPFSWKPVRRGMDIDVWGDYTYQTKAITIEEAFLSGYLEEQIYPEEEEDVYYM